jgi:hypothetical protein
VCREAGAVCAGAGLPPRPSTCGGHPDGDRLNGDPAEPSAGKTTLAGVDTQRLAHDQTWFLMIFVVKVCLGFLAFAIKPWLGPVFFAIYGLYVWRELLGGGPASEPELDLLTLQRRRVVPTRAAVVAQTVGSLVLIFAASQLFVRQLDWAGPALGPQGQEAANTGIPARLPGRVLGHGSASRPEMIMVACANTCATHSPIGTWKNCSLSAASPSTT